MIQLNHAPFDIEMMVTSQTPGIKGSQIIHGKFNGKLHSVIARSYVLSRPARPGEWWRFTGEWDTDPRYHNQLIANFGEPISVEGEKLKEYIIRHPKLRVGQKGTRVGERTWLAAIKAAKGADKLAQLINKEDYDGIRALGVGRLTHNIELVLQSWTVLRGELEAVKLCAKHKLGSRLSSRLIKHYGERLPTILRTDCYKILAYDRNTKLLYQNCDKIADSLGYSDDDPRRLQGAVDFIFNFRLDQAGHTAIERKTLYSALVRRFKEEQIAELAIEAALNSGAVQESPEGLLQSRPVAYAEAMIERRFVTMIRSTTNDKKVFPPIVATKAEQVFLLAEKPVQKDGKIHSITLSDEQKVAITLPFEQRLSLITGGAGTGKTTVISSVVRLAKSLKIDVFQMALSGQAADVMRSYNEHQAIDSLSRTIHWYVVPLEEAEINPNNPVPPRDGFEQFTENCLVIIDESSMIDLSLMNRLINQLPASARIVMVGDHNQIPPIGPGLIFHLCCHNESVPIARLTIPHRSAAKTKIPSVADSISKGVPPELPTFSLNAPTPEHGVYFLPASIDKSDEHSLARVIFQVAEKLGLKKTQVITTHRKSSNKFGHVVQSIHNINEYFQAQSTTGITPELKAWGINEGDPVIVRKNVVNVGGNGFDLFNGSLGELESATNCTFKFGEQTRELTTQDIARLGITLGYALTVHSFQGSAAEYVVIAVAKSSLLDRSLLYTALTRAKKTVVFVGDQHAFNDAVTAIPKWQTIHTAFNIDRSFQ